MLIKLISYGHRYYEEVGEQPPYHDFLFSVRDLKNPYWVPELKEFNGLDQEIIEYFVRDDHTQKRLEDINEMIFAFIKDFAATQNRKPEDKQVYAFKCTGGKHRSVYFAEQIFTRLKKLIAENDLSEKLNIEVEHVDLPRYLDKVAK